MLLGLGTRTTEATAPGKSAEAPKDQGIAFFSKKARLWQGRSQIIYFQVAQTAPDDRYYSFQVDEKVLHLLIPPRILKGETIGYLRVKPLVEGKTQIGVENAKLDLEMVPDNATATISGLQPQIVTPASGADVWGEFEVGVEQLSLDDPENLPTPDLLLPNGKELTGHAVPDQKPGPHARWSFTVDATELSPGPNRLIAVQIDGSGKKIWSNSVYVNAIQPAATSLLTGNCPDSLDGDRTANDGNTPPKAVNDDKLGQGMVVDNGDEGRSWCLPVWIEKKGNYQMMVTARGEFGGDALPTLAILVDEEGQPQTTARLATTAWQRLPVGHPITLEAGGHILSMRIRNGFGQGPLDTRYLFIQKYEFARVDKSALSLVAAGSGPGGVGSTMMAMAAANHPDSSGGGSSMMAMAAANRPGSAAAMGDLHVVFANNLDGQMVTGTVDVAGHCWWPDRDHTPPPRVDLVVNHKLVGSQRARDPHFTLDPAAFSLGPNVVELRATLPSGDSAVSTPFTLDVPKDFPLPKHPFRPTVSFTRYDSGLSNTTPPQPQGDPDVTTMASNGESTVEIPSDLTGKYKVVVDGRGDDYQGPPLVTVGFKSDGKETKLGDFPVGPKMGSIQAGQVVLAPGAKELTIAFNNDLCDAGKGDRNLFVRSVRLIPIEDVPDTLAPRISITYAPKSVAGRADVVVARVMDDTRVASSDLMIDHQPQHLDQTPLHGLGPVVLPLLVRDLKPGTHRLQVVAKDDAGNQGASAETSFTVAASPSTALSKYERAVFLLNRFGYGPEPGEINAILTLGEKPWLELRLASAAPSAAEANEQEAIRAQFPNLRDGGQVTSSAIEYLLTEPNPVRARFLVWTENHFSTWISKDGASAKGREHQNFVELGTAPFFDLLLTSATSPAMLLYLDQRYSYSHRLNENYAREIMELHTLGVKGGYTQKDVTTLADLLTGWTLADEAPDDGSGGELDHFFGYDPHLNTANGCRVFGVEFPGVEAARSFDRPLMVLEMLSSHPSCAQFISRKLCEQYVSDPAPPKLVDDLAQVYLETGGDISAMLVAMSQHPDFWSSPGKVASPIDFAVRSARMARTTNPGPVNDLISGSGMAMFDRATPDGYPEDNGYNVNSNALLQRWRFAKSVQNDYLGSGMIPKAWRPADAGWNSGVTQRIVDLAAVRMTGNVLTDASNDAAQKLLADAPAQTDVRLHALATFICQLPENSLK